MSNRTFYQNRDNQYGNNQYGNYQQGYHNGPQQGYTNNYHGGPQYGNNPNSYQESFRWNSGYASDYASPKEDRPSLTSRVLSFFNHVNERRIAKKHPPVVKVTNASASYDSAEVNGGYEDYVFKSSKDLSNDSFDQ